MTIDFLVLLFLTTPHRDRHRRGRSFGNKISSLLTVMPPALQFAAPSHTLVRLVRAHAENLNFLATNLGASWAASFRCGGNKTTRQCRSISWTRWRHRSQSAGLVPPVGSRQSAFFQSRQDRKYRVCQDETRLGRDESILASGKFSSAAARESMLQCTEVDEGGNVVMYNANFKKSELIAKYGLLPRDLRKIDSSNLPHVFVRPSAILINLLHLKVLIRHNRVLFFDMFGHQTSTPQNAFLADLKVRLQAPVPKTESGQVQNRYSIELPYEFRALEAVLISVTQELEINLEDLREPVDRILGELKDDIDRDKLRWLLVWFKKVTTFEQKARLVRDALEELLNADDDLAAMYLTQKTHGLARGEDDHGEVELLLESYHKICDEVAQQAAILLSDIRNTEDISRAILDANRNALMLLDLKFSIGTLGLAAGTLVAGLYGMNLRNFMESTSWGFGAVTGGSFVLSVLVVCFGFTRLRKLRRIGTHLYLDPYTAERVERLKRRHHERKWQRWGPGRWFLVGRPNVDAAEDAGRTPAQRQHRPKAEMDKKRPLG